MIEPIENEYFNWLCAKVIAKDAQNYRDLLKILHETEFVWVVSADRHREADGQELRQDFLRDTRFERDTFWEGEPCSILEVLISFAMRAAFQTDIGVKDWFWVFITNLGLEDCRYISRSDVPKVQSILDTFLWRTYDSNGYGGLFPMKHSNIDQRGVEIWYQFCEWVSEHELV